MRLRAQNLYGNLETKIDWSWHASRGLDQILKNDTDLRDADQRITGTVLQFYKIDNTIRVADLRKYFTNKTREFTLYSEGIIWFKTMSYIHT